VEFSDLELIAEIRAGSVVAFERLVRRYERLVHRVALAYTGDPQAALDVSQNVFLRVHAKLGSYRGEGELRSWVLRLTGNESRNFRRTQRRHHAEDLSDEIAIDTAAPQERQLLLRRSLDALGPRPRLAIVLRYFVGSSTREIAAALGCSEGVAKNVLFRSLKKMRTQLCASTEVRP
jgi:RNA polymerase sigma factor (sigma-70 family)